jgi:hypothetical protein
MLVPSPGRGCSPPACCARPASSSSGGEQILADHRRGIRGSRLDDAGVADDQRDADAALVHRPLAGPERGVAGRAAGAAVGGQPAVVAREHDDRPVGQLHSSSLRSSRPTDRSVLSTMPRRPGSSGHRLLAWPSRPTSLGTWPAGPSAAGSGCGRRSAAGRGRTARPVRLHEPLGLGRQPVGQVLAGGPSAASGCGTGCGSSAAARGRSRRRSVRTRAARGRTPPRRGATCRPRRSRTRRPRTARPASSRRPAVRCGSRAPRACFGSRWPGIQSVRCSRAGDRPVRRAARVGEQMQAAA